MDFESFKCKSCGNCCRVSGYVHLDDKDVFLIAEYLQIPKRTFTEEYTCLTSNRQGLSLIESQDGSCVFLKNNRCEIYPVRPWQCQTFPFKWRVTDVEKFCSGYKTEKPV